jgi:predicted RNase H-like HicB family nuclease
MSKQYARITMRIINKGGYWIALAEDVPDFHGGVAGDTLAELHEEIEAVKHFAVGVPKETRVDVNYIYEIQGVPIEIVTDYWHLREQRDEVTSRLNEAAATAVAALRGAGLSVRDAAAVLGISRSRVDQLTPRAASG